MKKLLWSFQDFHNRILKQYQWLYYSLISAHCRQEWAAYCEYNLQESFRIEYWKFFESRSLNKLLLSQFYHSQFLQSDVLQWTYYFPWSWWIIKLVKTSLFCKGITLIHTCIREALHKGAAFFSFYVYSYRSEQLKSGI